MNTRQPIFPCAVAGYLASVGIALVLTWFLAATNALAQDYAAPGAAKVVVRDVVWRDVARGRDLPVKLRIPAGLIAKTPVIVFSHGLGGSREGGVTWGEHWASHGYIVIHVQHPGSDEALWKGEPESSRMGALTRAMTPANLKLRVADASFVVSEVERLAGSGDFAFADPARIGMSGHSFGAQTTLALAGMSFPMMREASPFADPRFKAAIVFSPNARDSRVGYDQQFGSIKGPMLHLTGSKDGAVTPGDKTQPADRKLPFVHSPAPGKYLAFFDGGDHMVFGGHLMRRTPTARDTEIQADVKALSLAFWNAHLRGDTGAAAWLAGPARGILAANDEYAVK